MRRIRRYYDEYDRYNNPEMDIEKSPTRPYFHSRNTFSDSRKSSAECVREDFRTTRCLPKLSNEHLKDATNSYYDRTDERDISQCNKNEGESDDYDEVYEVVSEGHIAKRHQRNPPQSRYSDHEILKNRTGKVSPVKPYAKKIVCKFCASSRQFGSCPCPIHLPTVQSRYLRQIQDDTRNAITINVFRNGDYRVTPTMVHIPKFHMRSMEDILKIVDKFVHFPVGYAYALYTVLGDLVEDPMELEPYEVYVVVNNCKRQFIPMEYGSKRSGMDNSRRRRRIPQSTFGLTSLARA